MRTVLVQLKCTYTCMSSAAHVPTEFREIDFREVEKVEEFCRGGCGCSTNCASAFTKKHYLTTRANAQQLERKDGSDGPSDGIYILQSGTTEHF